MQIKLWLRGAASVCALGVMATPMASGVAFAAPSAATKADTCSADTKLTILSFNDFHGRLAASSPDTVGFFGEIEKLRKSAGEDSTLVLANGDNIGGSLFASASQDDNPTLDILNAADIDVSSVGNHEYDKGQKDFNDRVKPRAKFGYVAANVTGPGAPKPYQIFTKAGVKVAVVGAVTGDLPSLVSPAGMQGLTVTDPVEAVNKVAKQLKDGNEANGEADVIIAAYHEGAPGSGDYATESKTAIVKKMVEGTDKNVSAIYNAHTHQTYVWEGKNGAGTRPVVQSASYASLIGKVELAIDPATKSVGNCYTAQNVKPAMSAKEAAAAYPRAAKVQTILDKTLKEAEVVGAVKVGEATADVTRALPGGKEDRGRESAMTNLVANMFKDQLGKKDPNFIGMQNPGGTRADFDKGDITYKEAASVLPFANSLMTTQITGAQLKTVLEQQWQRDKDGKVPARPYLQLGLSDNVKYTYDESRAEGDRITGIWVSGKAVTADAKYTVGSGSFLIAGGDNFHALAKGTNTKDSGRVDLEAFVDYIKQLKTVSPDFAKHAVSVKGTPKSFTVGKAQTFAVGVPVEGAKAADTLDMTSTGAVKNGTLVAEFVPTGGKAVKVGEAKVVDGKVASISVTMPSAGEGVLRFTAAPSKTVAQFKVSVTGGDNGSGNDGNNGSGSDGNNGSGNDGKDSGKDDGKGGKDSDGGLADTGR